MNIPLRHNVETKRWKRPLEIWIPLFAGACLTRALLTSAPSISVFLGEKMLYLLSRRAWRCYHWSPLNNASDRHICLHIGEIHMYPFAHTYERGGNRWMFTDMSLLLLCKISVCVCMCMSYLTLDITAVSLNIDSLVWISMCNNFFFLQSDVPS